MISLTLSQFDKYETFKNVSLYVFGDFSTSGRVLTFIEYLLRLFFCKVNTVVKSNG